MLPITTRLYVSAALLVAAIAAAALVPDLREYAIGVASPLVVLVLDLLRADYQRRSRPPQTSPEAETLARSPSVREATGPQRLPAGVLPAPDIEPPDYSDDENCTPAETPRAKERLR